MICKNFTAGSFLRESGQKVGVVDLQGSERFNGKTEFSRKTVGKCRRFIFRRNKIDCRSDAYFRIYIQFVKCPAVKFKTPVVLAEIFVCGQGTEIYRSKAFLKITVANLDLVLTGEFKIQSR